LFPLDVRVRGTNRRQYTQASVQETVRILCLKVWQEPLAAEAAFLRACSPRAVPHLSLRGAGGLQHDALTHEVEGSLGPDVDRAGRCVGVDIGADGLGHLD